MIAFHLEPAADDGLDDIYLYTHERWGADQADRYITGLFACFTAIAKREIPWRRIPADYGVDGYFCRYERHHIYWMPDGNHEIRIVAILHQSMELKSRLRESLRP